ncbi:hypothetical protein KR074_008288, partial [Drosophila pseudoananassae]
CFFVTFGILVAKVLGECNKCQEDNNIKCINQTHFSFCSEYIDNSQVVACPEGQVCTSLKAICMPEGAVEPSCTAVECPSCDGTSIFVCTSRTTFQMCNGNTLTSQVSKCKANTYCSIRSGTICADRCWIENNQIGFECDRESPA